jgi:hypothetical protein
MRRPGSWLTLSTRNCAMVISLRWGIRAEWLRWTKRSSIANPPQRDCLGHAGSTQTLGT